MFHSTFKGKYAGWSADNTALTDCIGFVCADGETTLKLYKDGHIDWNSGIGATAGVISTVHTFAKLKVFQLQAIISTIGKDSFMTVFGALMSIDFTGDMDFSTILMLCMLIEGCLMRGLCENAMLEEIQLALNYIDKFRGVQLRLDI
ncbi:hypothetical protein QQS21_002084 [Conoideocrella luteorostrata]|uniref:Uncharacterized protein n=1 Tax=Conoideocrella luteorostrata TaxID=1105319 RepID=A0AAJ0FXK3_9HYPO|nr:hypothetical protein QQS21_002084 [Conoideocrella luteorostrata]